MNQIDCINKPKDHDTIKLKINEDIDRIKTEDQNDEESVMKVHILRCFECSFESVDRLKFDTHLPCVLKDPPIVYTIYKCCICSTISTSRLIMDEHKQIYHEGEDNIIIKEIQDHLKPHLLINETKEIDQKKVSHPSTFQSNTSHVKLMHSNNIPNALDFSKKISKPISSHFDYSCRSQNVDLFNPSSKPLIDCLMNNWQKPPTNSSSNIQYSKRENLIPNLYNFAMISSMIQKQQNQQQNSSLSCSICKINFQNNDDLVRHIYFFHNPSLNHESGSLMASLAANNGSFLKDFQASSGLQSCLMSNPLWLNAMKLKSYNSNFVPSIQFPLVCPFCKSVFFNFIQLDLHISQVHSNGTNIPNNFIKPNNFTSPENENKHFYETNTNFYNEYRRSKMSKNDPLNTLDMKPIVSVNPIEMDLQEPETNNKTTSHTKNNSCSDEKKTNSSTNSENILENHDLTQIASSPDNLFSNLKPTPQSQMIVHNTMRKTKSDLKVINRYLSQVKSEHRPVQDIPPEELNIHLQDFVLNAKKKDGHEYEPESLKAFVHSLERYLKAFHNYPVSVLKDQQFNGTRTMLHQRLQELRLKSKSINNQNSLNSINKYSINHSSQSIQDLFKYEIIGHENPQALINTLWLINRVLFHIGGVHKHKNLLWGQFNLTQVFGQTCLQYYPNKVNFVGASIKDLDMELFSSKESDTPVSIGRGDSRLPVDAIEIFQIYANMRPVECRNMTDPFYLCPDPIWKKGGSWFKPINAGFQYISKIPRLMGFKTSSALKSAGSTPVISSVLPSTTTVSLTNKDSDMLDYESSQIIDIDSQTIDEDNHSSGSSHSVSVYEQQNTTNDKNTLTLLNCDEQSEAMDMSAKLYH